MMEELIKSGVEAARAGDYEKARGYFVKVVQADPKNETGWLLLGNTLEDGEKKKYCYQKVLALNPANQQALKALADLTQPEGQAQAAPPMPEPVEAHPPDESSGRQKKNSSRPILILGGIGLAIVLLAFVFFVIFSGALADILLRLPAGILPAQLPAKVLPTQTHLPTATLKATSTRTPSRTPRSSWTPFSMATEYLPPFVPNAGTPVLTTYGTIDYWDQFIEENPDNANAYFQRASLIYKSAVAIGSQEYYLYQLDLALKDIDQAIAIRSDVGDYYALRQSLYYYRGAETESAVDAHYLINMALDNAYKAYQLGTTTEYPERIIIIDLIFTDQCQKALDEIEKQIPLVPAGTSSLGGLLHIRSQAYACLGKLEEALASVNDSMFNNKNMGYKNELKFQYLIMLGRYDEALPLLDERICNCTLAGWYYYWRAEIYYNTGKKDLVQTELEAGMPRTWSRGGMLPYVEAQLALDEGRMADAIELLQEAEASLNPAQNPLRWKIQKMLASLGAKPLALAPSSPYQATPIP